MGRENYRLPKSIPLWSLQTADEDNQLSQSSGESPWHSGHNAQLEYDNGDLESSVGPFVSLGFVEIEQLDFEV